VLRIERNYPAHGREFLLLLVDNPDLLPQAALAHKLARAAYYIMRDQAVFQN
jgi:hypothetical protein